MSSNVIEEREILEKRLVESRDRLREKNPNDSLLALVSIDSTGIHWTSEFGGMYEGMSVLEGLRKYVTDMEEALDNYL